MSKTDYEKLRRYYSRGWAVTLGSASVLISFAPDAYKNYILSGTAESFFAIAAIGATVLWLLAFGKAMDDELRILEDYSVLEQTPTVDWQEYSVAVILSLGFGCLFASIPHPIVFCILAAVIQVCDSIGVNMIQRALLSAREIEDNCRRSGRAVQNAVPPFIFKYYINNWHLVHRVSKMLGFMIALFLFGMARFSQRPNWALLGWATIVVTILGGEYSLFRWRITRDRDSIAWENGSTVDSNKLPKTRSLHSKR